MRPTDRPRLPLLPLLPSRCCTRFRCRAFLRSGSQLSTPPLPPLLPSCHRARFCCTILRSGLQSSTPLLPPPSPSCRRASFCCCAILRLGLKSLMPLLLPLTPTMTAMSPPVGHVHPLRFKLCCRLLPVAAAVNQSVLPPRRLCRCRRQSHCRHSLVCGSHPSLQYLVHHCCRCFLSVTDTLVISN